MPYHPYYKSDKSKHVAWRGSKVPAHFIKTYDQYANRQRMKNPAWKDIRSDDEILNYMNTSYKQRNSDRAAKSYNTRRATKQNEASTSMEGQTPLLGYGFKHQSRKRPADDGLDYGSDFDPEEAERNSWPADPTHNPADLSDYEDMHGDDDGFADGPTGATGIGAGVNDGGVSKGDTIGVGFNRVSYQNPSKMKSGGVKSMYFEQDYEHTAFTFNADGDIVYDTQALIGETVQANAGVGAGTAYSIPYHLKRASVRPVDLVSLMKTASFARMKKCGFFIKSANIKETVIEGSDNNPKLRNKTPNDFQIQYKWDVNGDIATGRPRRDVFEGNADQQKATSTCNRQMKVPMMNSCARSAFSKELPYAEMVQHLDMTDDEGKLYFNNLFNARDKADPDTVMQTGRDMVTLSDELKTTSLESIVGRRFNCEWGRMHSWLACHIPRPRHAVPLTGIPDTVSYDSYNEDYERQHQPYLQQYFDKGVGTLGNHDPCFPNNLAFNTSWPERQCHFYNYPTGNQEGLMDGFPRFVFRIRDEEDLQGPITRYCEMVITYFAEIEYIPIVMPADHIFMPKLYNLHLATDYTTPADEDENHGYNIAVTRQYVTNKMPIIGFQNAHTFGWFPLSRSLDKMGHCGQGINQLQLQRRKLPLDSTLYNTSRLMETAHGYKVAQFLK